MLTDQVRRNLAAPPGQSDDESGSDFPTHQSRALNGGTESESILRPQVQNREKYDRGQGETLTYRLQQLRGQELLRTPVRCQAIADHETGCADEGKTDASPQAPVSAA